MAGESKEKHSEWKEENIGKGGRTDAWLTAAHDEIGMMLGL